MIRLRCASGLRQIVQVDNDVQTRAKELNAKGVMALDALHLAAA
jgi:hypothetical protein